MSILDLENEIEFIRVMIIDNLRLVILFDYNSITRRIYHKHNQFKKFH